MNLRAYLQKGGFLIVDDFPSAAQRHLGQLRHADEPRVPRGPLDPARRDASDLPFVLRDQRLSNIPTAYNLGSGPQFWALFEDNDPKKRMLAIANYMNDISEFWEFSETGRYIVQDSNLAYKFGVNEFIYGITH